MGKYKSRRRIAAMFLVFMLFMSMFGEMSVFAEEDTGVVDYDTSELSSDDDFSVEDILGNTETWYEDYTFETSNDTMYLKKYNGEGADVVVKPTVSYNGKIYKISLKGMVYSSTSIKSLKINDGVSVTSTFPEIDKDNTIFCETCFACKELESVEIPSDWTYIPSKAFNGCSKLKEINLPDGVKTIHDMAFANCPLLTIDKLPNSLERIGELAFSGCNSLNVLEIPNSVEYIYEDAFINCLGLTYISLPKKLRVLGDKAFQNCPKLTRIKFDWEHLDVSIGNDVFYLKTEDATLTLVDSTNPAFLAYNWIGDNRIINTVTDLKPDDYVENSEIYFEAEPNNSKEAATKLVLGKDCYAEIGSYTKYKTDGTDVDWFSIDLAQRTQYRFNMDSYNAKFASTTLIIEIYDPSGNRISLNYEMKSDGIDYHVFVTKQSGTYYIRLNNYTDYNNKTTEHPYSIRVDDQGSPFGNYDEVEPNNSRDIATKLTLNKDCRAEIGYYVKYQLDGEDIDWFSVDLKAGTKYRISMEKYNESFASTSVIAYLYDPVNKEIGLSYEYKNKGVNYYDLTPNQSGTYYIKLYNYFDTDTITKEHPYTLCVKEIKPYAEKDSDSVVVSAEDINGGNIYVNVSMTSMVMFNGKKHVVSSGKNNKTYVNDIAITIDDGNLSQFATPKYTYKNNKNVPQSSSKRPQIILSYKAKKGATKAEKKIIKKVNQELKYHPFYFDIAPLNIENADDLKVSWKKNKIKKISVVVNGNTVAIPKGYYTYEIRDGYATITGLKNFAGTVTVPINR